MPANKEAFIRYRIIDSLLRDKQKPFPKMSEIIEKCEECLGTEFSESTIQKDIYAMRFDQGLNYNAPIKYKRLDNGYYYSDPNYSIASIALNSGEINAIEFAAGILEQFKGTELHAEFDHAVDKILQTLSIRKILKNDQIERIIQVEKAFYFRGTEHLSALMELIKKSQIITFDYQSYEREGLKSHILHPYLLKEYKNRWYVVGFHPVYKQIRTFGIDRITNINSSKDKYKVMDDFDPTTYFQHSFGITINNNKPEEVVLSFTPKEGKYIKSQSIHRTQKIILDTDKEVKISINVVISPELEMQVLGYGNDVKVMKPAHFAKTIKEKHELAAERYKSPSM